MNMGSLQWYTTHCDLNASAHCNLLNDNLNNMLNDDYDKYTAFLYTFCRCTLMKFRMVWF